MKDKHLNEREIILEDNGYYWLRFKYGFDKQPQIGQYDKVRNTFQLIGKTKLESSDNFDVLSDIILRETDFVKF